MSRFTIPQSFSPGVLDRVTAPGKLDNVPMYREVAEVVPESDWLDIIRGEYAPNGRELVHTVLSQGSVGSCASESKDGAVMITRAGAHYDPVVFNPYGTYGRVNGGRDRGSSLDENVRFAKEYGCFPEEIWPRSKGWRAKPSDEAYEAAYSYRLDEVRDIDNSSSKQFYAEFFSALLTQDDPKIYFGYPGHAICATRAVEEANAPPQAIEAANELDSYLLATGLLPCLSRVGGLVDELLIEYLNSWDKTWGDNGFGYLRASRVQRSYGAFQFLSVVDAT